MYAWRDLPEQRRRRSLRAAFFAVVAMGRRQRSHGGTRCRPALWLHGRGSHAPPLWEVQPRSVRRRWPVVRTGAISTRHCCRLMPPWLAGKYMSPALVTGVENR